VSPRGPAAGLPDLVGNTPLFRLRQVSEATGCEILGKAEFLNPGGSVKDRTALGIIRDAEARGVLKPGGRIVEGTAGNTGIGLCLLGNALGYRTSIVIPESMSPEKIAYLELCGAELELVPAVPYSDDKHYVKVSERLARRYDESEAAGALWANQFDNVANRAAHRDTTGVEIWEQTGGRVDAFVCAVGTGGTLAGVSDALKARNPAVRIGLADPHGAALYSWFRHGRLESEGDSIAEGIGQSRVTRNLEGAAIDDAWRISDAEALPYVYDILEHEGLCLGGSSAINIAGAVNMARRLGPGHTIVTILCDYGTRYQSRLYNPAYLRRKGLPVPAWLD
jgi:cysteine synthase A